MLQKAAFCNSDFVVDMFAKAVQRMSELGIDQWDELYPSESIIRSDIENGRMYIGCLNDSIVSAVTLNEQQDPEYDEVAWKFSCGRICVIHRLCVHPDKHGKGIGKKTIMLIEEVAACLHYDYIRLDAFTNNPTALSIYKSLGNQYAGDVTFRKGKCHCFEKTLTQNQ